MANPNQPQKELTDRIKSVVDGIGSQVHPDSCTEGTRMLMYRLSEQIKHAQLDTPEAKQVFIEDLTRDGGPKNVPNGSNAWYPELKKIHGHYALAYTELRRLKDAEKSVHRNERKAQFRALGFRIATTLGIGFSVMIVYGVASCLGLSMPLSRMNLS